MNISETLRAQIASNQRISLWVGIVFLVICGVVFSLDTAKFFQAYLLGYMFWMHLTLGCLGLVMMHNLTGGAWGDASRRFLEAGMRTLWLMALLFLPIFFLGLPYLYPWANPEQVAHNAILQQKAFYLNREFFGIRAVGYFAFWIFWAYMLYKGSQDFERTPTLSIVRRLENISGPGALLFALVVTLASVDWMMSLEPAWYSTIYGILFVVGQGLTGLAFAIVLATWFAKYEPFSELLTPKHFHDLGNLMVGFVVLWTYGSFSQFLIIWSANLPEEIPWYLHRIRGGWQVIAMFLMIFHFFVPFFVLLSRQLKRKKNLLVKVAAWMLFVRFVDLFWWIIPAFPNTGLMSVLPQVWLYAVTFLGIGGAWLATFFWQLQARSLLPLPDSSYEAVTGELEHAQKA